MPGVVARFSLASLAEAAVNHMLSVGGYKGGATRAIDIAEGTCLKMPGMVAYDVIVETACELAGHSIASRSMSASAESHAVGRQAIDSRRLPTQRGASVSNIATGCNAPVAWDVHQSAGARRVASATQGAVDESHIHNSPSTDWVTTMSSLKPASDPVPPLKAHLPGSDPISHWPVAVPSETVTTADREPWLGPL